MTTKQGRPRRFHFGSTDDPLGAELTFQLGFLDEMAVRVEDQVAHLPPSALNYTGANSTLSIGQLLLHLVAADLNMLKKAIPRRSEPPYQARLVSGSPADFASAPGDLSHAPEVLKAHLVYRRTHLLEKCRVEGFLDRSVDHPACHTNRELVSQLVWHWSYHSGQIGLIALEAGFDYVWTSTLKG